MFWFVRAAWGCLFTAYVLGGESYPRWRSVGLNEAWVVALITVVGFGPVFMPATRWKALGMLCGILGSYGFLAAGGRSPWLCLVLGWGPLLVPTAIVQVRRAFGEGRFAMAGSVLHDAHGAKAEWTFANGSVEIAVDLANLELRIRAREARVSDASFASTKGPATIVYPLLDCDFRFTEVIETKHHNLTGMAYGTTSSGEQVSMVVPQQGYSTEHHTGRYAFTVDRRPKELAVTHDFVTAAANGSIQYHGKLEERMGKHLASVSLDNLSSTDSAHLMSAWKDKVEPMIAQARAARGAALLSEREAVTTEAYRREANAQRERQRREAQELSDRTLRGAALVAARLDGLREAASVGEGFREVSHDVDGAVDWAIAVDRQGRGVIIDARGEWSGGLEGAQASIDVVEKGGGKSLDTLELLIQVDDAAFEAEHLCKRRLRIMRGHSKDSLMTWADRILLLSKIEVDSRATSVNAGTVDAS